MALHKTPYHVKEAMNALLRYCAYRDRSEYEVKQKMKTIGVPKSDEKKLIDWLKETKALNEARYTESFTRGKFHLKKWGKKKIAMHLKHSGTSEKNIDKSLKNLDAKEYDKTIRLLIDKKNNTLKDTDPYIRKNKIARYLLSKGFEAELIWRIINEEV